MTIRFYLLALLLAAPVAWSDTAPPQGPGARAEFWLVVSSWPALETIRPAAGGRFDPIGFGLGGAYYLTLREFPNSELLAGIDGFIAASESNIEGVLEDVLARQLYLGGSLKWALGERGDYAVVAGLGYHLVDMAEVGDYGSGFERKVWETSRASAYVGASWDLPLYSVGRSGRWMLGLKVHSADFGTVNGPGPIGPDAGKLDEPQYTLRIGYGLR